MLLNPYRFAQSGGGGIDPYWGNVVLLLNLDEDTMDASARGKQFEAVGNAMVAGGALQLDGSGDWISTTDGMEDFRFGTGDFAVELFLMTSTSREMVAIDFYRGDDGGFWALEVLVSGIPYWYSQSSESANINVRDGTFHHVAFSRQSGTCYFFVDGVLSRTAAHTIDYNNTTVTKFSVGAQVDQRNPSYDFAGAIKGVRVTKGSARGYTSNFAVPSFPLPVGD